MGVTRRDVLIASATAGTGALLTSPILEERAHAASLPSMRNLQIVMRGLFLLDATPPASGQPQSAKFYFLKPGEAHSVALSVKLSHLDKYPPGATITLDSEGAELATWVFTSRSDLTISERATPGVTLPKSTTPKKWDDIAWIASVPELTGVDNTKFQERHAHIKLAVAATTGKLVVLSPSNKKKGEHCWKFSSGKTAQVTDWVLYESATPAKQATVTWGDHAWTFVENDVRLSLTSLPPPGEDDLAHFHHFAELFVGRTSTPVNAACATSFAAPAGPRESGTAYCPPGKRP